MNERTKPTLNFFIFEEALVDTLEINIVPVFEREFKFSLRVSDTRRLSKKRG